jgi:hypothetical protein
MGFLPVVLMGVYRCSSNMHASVRYHSVQLILITIYTYYGAINIYFP